VLTDGFPVAGLPAPGLAVWKGDRVSASIAAASVIAKVTRDRIMVGLHDRWPEYDFADHKGYVTPVHNAALDAAGPCPEHRFSYINVARRARGDARIPTRTLVRVGEDDQATGVVDVDEVDTVGVVDVDVRELEEAGSL
jgi:ribonuclease HII